MSENNGGESSNSPHEQYAKAYVGILNAYCDQLSTSVNKKNELKEKFMVFIKVIMYIMTGVFGVSVVTSLILLMVMAVYNTESVEIITGAIVSIISTFVSMLLGIIVLPRMIAEYLFNKEEDKQMTEVIVNIQKYELDAGRVENMRNRAEVDAMANITNQMLDPSNVTDSGLKSYNYIDAAIKKEALQKALSNDDKSKTS